MRRRPRPKAQAAWVILCATLAASSCSRPGGLPSDSAQADQGQVPFQNAASTPENSEPILAPPDQRKTLKGENVLPFRESQGLPAGTLVTVRLKTPISSDYRGDSLAFGAIVDEPVLVEGNTLLPRGASVAGRVESVRTSRMRRDRGYIRLTLDAINLEGRDLSVQTSSLFVHGNAPPTSASNDETSSQVIHLERGHRLTFRLIEPVSLASDPR